MTTFTHPRLREIATYLDSIRGQLTCVIADTPRAALTVVPAPGKWSGAQIIQHLGKVEGSTAKLLEGVFSAALAAGLNAEASTESVLGSIERFEADGEGLRPIVAPERLRPSDDADLDASWASLQAVRERTYRAYSTVDGRDLTAVIAPHPLFGPLTGYEWLLFLGKHEERHLAQLNRQLIAA